MDKLLPIGSIVKIRSVQCLSLMIMGYYRVDEEKQEVYEYAAVVYPHGMMGEESVVLLKQSDIEEVVFKGCDDEESQNVCVGLPTLIQSIALGEENPQEE